MPHFLIKTTDVKENKITILDKDFKFDMLKVLPQAVNAVVMLFIFLFSLIQAMRMSKAYKRTLAGTFGGINYNQQFAPTDYNQQQYGPNGEPVAPEPPRYQPNMIDKFANNLKPKNQQKMYQPHNRRF